MTLQCNHGGEGAIVAFRDHLSIFDFKRLCNLNAPTIPLGIRGAAGFVGDEFVSIRVTKSACRDDRDAVATRCSPRSVLRRAAPEFSIIAGSTTKASARPQDALGEAARCRSDTTRRVPLLTACQVVVTRWRLV